MPVEEFCVIWDQLRRGEGTDTKEYKGSGATEHVTLTGPLFTARYAPVEAESAGEAILFVKRQFPGEIPNKVIAVKKSSVTEE